MACVAAGVRRTGCGYALVGKGVDRRPDHQADRRAALQGHDRQGRARPEDHAEGRRGAAASAGASTWSRAAPASTPWWRASCCATARRPSGSAAATSATPQPGQPLRHHPHGARPLHEGRRRRSRSGRTTRSPSATSTTSAPTRRVLRPRGAGRSSGCRRSSRAASWRRCWRRSEAGRRAGVHVDRGRRLAAGRGGARADPGRAPGRSRAGRRRGGARRGDAPGPACSTPRARARCSRRGARWWCANAEALEGRGRRASPRYLEDPTPGVLLSCWPAKPDKRKGGLEAAARPRARCSAAEPLKGRALRALRPGPAAQARSCALREDALEELIERVGQDLRRLMGEIDKLEAFAADRDGSAHRRRRGRRLRPRPGAPLYKHGGRLQRAQRAGRARPDGGRARGRRGAAAHPGHAAPRPAAGARARAPCAKRARAAGRDRQPAGPHRRSRWETCWKRRAAGPTRTCRRRSRALDVADRRIKTGSGARAPPWWRRWPRRGVPPRRLSRARSAR